ncbi:MAG TPA: DMT family transporter, partial [Robiginitalea sp.]|nr:DMT family transporter [Robiginitalea sp.]
MDTGHKKAIGYMLLSTASFAVMNGLLKELNHLPPLEPVFFRSIGSAVIATSFLLRNGIPLLGRGRGLLMLRAALGVSAMSLFFTSLKYLPLGLAVSLRYTAPIYAVVFAWFLLGERISRLQTLFLGLVFSGVLILRGFSPDIDSFGLLLILLAAMFSGMVYIAIRKIGTREHPVVVVNYFMVLATMVGGVATLFHWVPPGQPIEWGLLLGLGIFGYFGQLFMTRAFQIGKTQQVAPFKYAEVIYALLIGIFFFGETYSAVSSLGVACILIGLSLYAAAGSRKEASG